MAAHLGNRLRAVIALAFGAVLLTVAGSAATPSAHASACGKWGKSAPDSISAPQARKAIACLINQKRDKAGLGDLDRDAKLQKAAQRHSKHMDGTGCFDHTCGGEADLGGRLENVGYLIGGLRQWAFGEIIAWGTGGQGTPKAIVRAWMHSSGHRANILDRRFKELGVGFSPGTPGGGGARGGIYTVDFGLRVG